jgi:hypothetical protein
LVGSRENLLIAPDVELTGWVAYTSHALLAISRKTTVAIASVVARKTRSMLSNGFLKEGMISDRIEEW